MEKMNCDIIQDLIPSYVDKVCSDASRKWVEEHLSKCSRCQEIAKAYQDMEFSAECIEQKELDGFKKIRKRIKRQNILSYGLLMLLAALGVYAFTRNPIAVPTEFYYVLFLICMISISLLTVNQKEWLPVGRIELVLAGISVLASCYGGCVLSYCISGFMREQLPFGIAPEKIGPLIHSQWGIVFLIQLILYGFMLIRVLGKNKDCRWILCIHLTGMFLMLAYAALLRRLDNVEIFHKNLMQITVVIVMLGIVGTVFYLVQMIGNTKRRQKDDGRFI